MLDDKELAEEIRKTRKDRERVDAIRVMLKSDGWRYYTELLDANVGERGQRLLEPTPDGQTLAVEHNKGAMYGITWARNLPAAIVAATKDERAPATEDEGDAD